MLLVDLDADASQRAVAELGEENAGYAVADITDTDAVAAAVAASVERFGALDVAFANAGIFGTIAPVTEYPEAVFEQVMRVNVLGPFLVAKHALRGHATAAAA